MNKNIIKIIIASLILVFIAVLVNADLFCEVTDSGCSYADVFHMSDLSNAHGELSNNSDYTYSVCCRDTGGAEIGIGCDGVTLLHLSNQTNAHAELATESEYSYDVCLNATGGEILYGYASNCDGYQTCVASVSTAIIGRNTNLHVADCVTDPYATKICANFSGDITFPIWEHNSTNVTGSTKYLDEVRFGINWSDDRQVNTTIFSWNGTLGGNLINDSALDCGKESCVFNITKRVDLTEGNTICWKWYANDTSNNVGETDEWCFKVCDDIDNDGVCDMDEGVNCVGDCVGQNQTNIPENSSCGTYYDFDFATGCWIAYCNSSDTVLDSIICDYNDKDCIIKSDVNDTCNGTGGIDYGDCIDSVPIFVAEGTECGTAIYKCNETGGLGSDVIWQRSYCNAVGGCIAADWEIYVDCPWYKYCDYIDGTPNCECDDSDNDYVCDPIDQCIGENESNLHPPEVCRSWILNSSGCHEAVNVPDGSVVNQTDCDIYDDLCTDYNDVNNTCQDGIFTQGICNDYVELPCEDPDVSRDKCRDYFSKTSDTIVCYKGYSDCWDNKVAFPNPLNDTACCGDDVNDTYSECWSDDTNVSGCCDGFYYTDPDDDGRFCNTVGVELDKRPEVGESSKCDTQNEQYCFATSLYYTSQDPNCCCCGDDIGETWSLFSSGWFLDEVIVGGSCENGRWINRTQVTSTLYDIWTYNIP